MEDKSSGLPNFFKSIKNIIKLLSTFLTGMLYRKSINDIKDSYKEMKGNIKDIINSNEELNGLYNFIIKLINLFLLKRNNKPENKTIYLN